MSRPLEFCAACGTKLDAHGDEGQRDCPSCGRTWYGNSAPTAGAAIVKDGKVLLTIRGDEPEKGKFDVPGGFLHEGEHPLDALRRELKEELQIEIDVAMDDCLQMVPHEYGDDGQSVLSIGFKATLTSGEPTPGSDVAEAKWVTLAELDELDFAWEHDRELARKALEDEAGR